MMWPLRMHECPTCSCNSVSLFPFANAMMIRYKSVVGLSKADQQEPLFAVPAFPATDGQSIYDHKISEQLDLGAPDVSADADDLADIFDE